MVLGFRSRKSTRDIDALVIAPSEVRRAIEAVARKHGYPAVWLNDGAKGFGAPGAVETQELVQSHLRVVTPPPEYILAMKCISAQTGLDEHDKEDAKFLVSKLGIREEADLVPRVEKYYPAPQIPAKAVYFMGEVINEVVPKS